MLFKNCRLVLGGYLLHWILTFYSRWYWAFFYFEERKKNKLISIWARNMANCNNTGWVIAIPHTIYRKRRIMILNYKYYTQRDEENEREPEHVWRTLLV